MENPYEISPWLSLENRPSFLTTQEGEDVSTKLLQELIAYGGFANMNKSDSDD